MSGTTGGVLTTQDIFLTSMAEQCHLIIVVYLASQVCHLVPIKRLISLRSYYQISM